MAAVTIDDILRLFQATDERIARMNEEAAKEAARSRAETEAEMARSRAETEAEMARRHAETEAVMARSRAETDAAMARSRAETDAALRELSRRMGHFSNQLGEFAEGMVAPAGKRLFAARGIPVHAVARNVEGERNGRAIEIDVLVINGEHVVAIEVKSRPKVEHIDEHLDRLAAFKEVFPEYRDRKLIGAIAGIVLDQEVARYAYRRGLFVLGQSGDGITILNDDKFRPKEW